MKLKSALITGVVVLLMLFGCGPGNHAIVEPDDNSGDNSGAMVKVAAGSFRMGSQSGLFEQNETPIHTVELDAYYIGKYEVTNKDFAAFLNDSLVGGASYYNASMDIVRQGTAYVPAVGLDNYPVRFVTWDGASAYARWIGGRLPTEAEWEKAARGPTGERIYPWGNNISPGQANFGNQFGGLWQVGKATGRSPCGCYDMSGNVWEWVADWYDKYYYSESPDRNPTGPVTGENRVLRGGSFMNSEMIVRCAKRIGADPSLTYQDVGFRCVIDTANFES